MSHTVQKRPKASNQPSQLLSNSENQQLFQTIGNRCVVSLMCDVFWRKICTKTKSPKSRSIYIYIDLWIYFCTSVRFLDPQTRSRADLYIYPRSTFGSCFVMSPDPIILYSSLTRTLGLRGHNPKIGENQKSTGPLMSKRSESSDLLISDFGEKCKQQSPNWLPVFGVLWWLGRSLWPISFISRSTVFATPREVQSLRMMA